MRTFSLFVLMVAAGSLASANDDVPWRVLLEEPEHVGRHEGLFEEAYYLWLHVEQLRRERTEWRLGLYDAQDVTLLVWETLAEFAQDDDESFLNGLIQPSAAPVYDLQNGQRIPADRHAEICRAADFDPSVDGRLGQPPEGFEQHVAEARGVVLGRVSRIEHGFSGMTPSLLLELDVEDTLIASDYSPNPYLVVATSGYVHEDTVYCSWPGMEGWEPAVDDRLIAMPVTGPWDKDGEIMPIVDPVEIFLVGEPDSTGVSKVTPLLERDSVPGTLLEFRHRVWNVLDELVPDGPER